MTINIFAARYLKEVQTAPIAGGYDKELELWVGEDSARAWVGRDEVHASGIHPHWHKYKHKWLPFQERPNYTNTRTVTTTTSTVTSSGSGHPTYGISTGSWLRTHC